MHKRKIRRHHSGTANLQLTSQLPLSTGQTFYDSMRRTMTQSLSKPLPSIAPKYGDPVPTDPRTFSTDKPLKASSKFSSSSSTLRQPNNHPRLNFQNLQDSYKNDVQETKPVLFDNNAPGSEKLRSIQGLLRRKYATRTKMFGIFNGWEGEPKGYISYQNLRGVLGLMGVNLTEQESKEFIRMHSPEEGKLHLNSFLNLIYAEGNQGEVEGEGRFEGVASLPGDDRFKNNFIEEQYDCRNIRMENINRLDSYHLEKALWEGQKIKNKLQKYLKSQQEAKLLLFDPTSPQTVKFEELKNKVVDFLKLKQGNVKWRQLQGFMSLYQYNINQELDRDTFCKGIFDNTSIFQRDYIHKNAAPIRLENRLATSDKFPTFSNSKDIDLKKCLKKIDEEIFRGSISNESVFCRFDKDRDGYVSEEDFVRTMAQHNILSEEESKNVFDHLGGNGGKDKSCLSFKEFSEQVRPGMGTQGEDQYPNFLRPKKVGEFRGAERFTKSHYFDPKSVADTNQRKTRFNGTPDYKYSTFGADGTRFWGTSGDLNAKVEFQKQEKMKLGERSRQRLVEIAGNREADERRREATQEYEEGRMNARMRGMAELKGSYERVNHGL